MPGCVGTLATPESLCYRIPSQYVRSLDANHPDTAITLTNLGSLLLDLGDVNGAQQHFECALAMRKVTLGTMHHDCANILVDWASIF